MQTYLNGTGVPLSVAVYLATDHYDYVPDTISATALMRPIRQQVLGARVPQEEKTADVLDLLKSRMGTSIHDGIEKAWTGHYKKAMKALGYPDKIINRVVVNPEGEVAPGAIPVYMEKRSYRSIMGKTVSGKFDFVAEGRVEDFKSTGVYTWVNNTKDEDYQLQGSIYRWLNPDIITQDVCAIQFFFTDWKAFQVTQKNYPPKPMMQKIIPLLSLEETEAYIVSKLSLYEQWKNADEDKIPLCTDKDLWRKEPVFKYYKNPANMKRATKNYDTQAEAFAHFQKDGGVGKVVEVGGEVVACKYCPAFSVCTQKDRLIADGSLIL